MENDIRVGIGYDVHHFTEDRPLILGGVKIPFDRGLSGWSDADVLLHSLIDALLGAAALGDIGLHFPPGDSQYKGISSLMLLRRVSGIIKEEGWITGNVDATIVAQEPKLREYIPAMRQAIAAELEIPVERVSVKASTSDGLGFVGRKEGIAACVTVLLKSIPGS